MRKLTIALALVLVPATTVAQRARSPADATVFIRVVGSVHVETDTGGIRQTGDLDRAEIGTGSGFVISPAGYVLTNDHLVDLSEPVVFGDATITFAVASIEACFSPDAVQSHGLVSACYPASIAASDRALDLAVLYLSGSSFPYIALGDSDAVAPGLAVDALGYPFGRRIEVARVAVGHDVVPDVSTTPGAVSALRSDDTGERKYLQISNTVNPGNSGGPLLDRNGFAVGVIRMALRNATGIGFAIPINQAKDFLESYGLDQSLPARRLRLGAYQSLEPKGMGLRLPEGLADVSTRHCHVETDARAAELALRIDRVLSPWPARRVAEALVGTESFEAVPMVARSGRPQPRSASPAVHGSADGTEGDAAREVRMEYAVLDLGAEKVVARYVGSAEWMAFNESVLRQSLASIEAQRSADAPLAMDQLTWSSVAVEAGQGIMPVPAGWGVDPGAPSRCQGLPPPEWSMVASRGRDLAIVIRAAVWPAGLVTPEAAATACSAQRGLPGGASYRLRDSSLGVTYVFDGVFARTGPAGQVVHLEVVSTELASGTGRGLLAAWLQKTVQ